VRLRRRSSIYETEPQEIRDQPWFLNLVIETEVRLFPRQLLNRALQIEREMGRRRTIAKGPRIIDIDILLYGRAVVETAELTIPHPAIPERRFVLEPLVELDAALVHPVLKMPLSEMLPEVISQVVRKADRQDF
jgi:2-amino-4-hydroxy-6-hydroxymethyldihydropteridine diphosphokinase